MISHMGNETSCLSGKNISEAGCSEVINHVGCLSVNTSPEVIHRLLRRNQSCRYFLDVIGPNKARRLSLDVIIHGMFLC